ncbi:MAG TPA: 16S rRNA (cytosine(1402)-N(4))-methyltransferase RsmH [Desulfarculaceae bacterium]|nr:16S rRNA (cytosine(1402)-N(4))-methyltransferase RsmH [Desulfarculaceae bacterium]
MMRKMEHVPVLLQESVEILLGGRRVAAGAAVIVDATFGGGGHTRRLLECGHDKVVVVAIDRDPAAIARSDSLQHDFGERFKLLPGNFSDLEQLLDQAEIGKIDGLLLDIGLSSFQLEEGARGFSFQSDGPLDMRMDPDTGEPAAAIIREADCDTLTRIFRDFGEEPYAGVIARKIVAARVQKPFLTTHSLAQLIADMVPDYKRSRRHPATKVFQALRIVVNDELGALEKVLKAGLKRLSQGGRMVVISYHSLEDRLVKRFFRESAKGCICPPGIPVCGCGRISRVKIINRSGLRPQRVEIERNPRSRSACLRAIERL